MKVQLEDEKKKEFYNYVDANWSGDKESDQEAHLIYVKVYNNNVDRALSKLKKQVKILEKIMLIKEQFPNENH